MVVCNIYKLLKDGKSFTKQGMAIKRTNSVVTREWAELNNESWKEKGLWFEIDDDLTDEYYEKGKQKRENRKKAQIKKTQLTSVVSDILETANKTVEDEDVVIEEDVSEFVRLKAEYIEKFGKKPFHKWGVKELTEKLK